MARYNLTTALLLLLFSIFSLLGQTTTSLTPPTFSSSSFETWRQLYNKTYTDKSEERLRRHVYEDNRKFVTGYRDEGSVVLELGAFADQTHEEFLGTIRRVGAAGRNKFKGAASYEKNEEIKSSEGMKDGEEMISCERWYGGDGASPSSINWQDKGAVTGVLKQTSLCPGNSYAIAALGAVTGQWYQESGRKIAFSEQQVVDCSRGSGNWGCNFGSAERTYSYIKRNGGIATRINYPTTGREGQCRTAVPLGPTITGCRSVAAGDEKTMKLLVGTVGPVTAVLDISPRSFQFYKSGVYSERTCHPPYADHHVLVTGYGTQYDQGLGKVVDYWVVKNCWGTKWGDKGYMRIIRNNYNHCGIANRVTVPYVDK